MPQNENLPIITITNTSGKKSNTYCFNTKDKTQQTQNKTKIRDKIKNILYVKEDDPEYFKSFCKIVNRFHTNIQQKIDKLYLKISNKIDKFYNKLRTKSKEPNHKLNALNQIVSDASTQTIETPSQTANDFIKNIKNKNIKLKDKISSWYENCNKKINFYKCYMYSKIQSFLNYFKSK